MNKNPSSAPKANIFRLIIILPGGDQVILRKPGKCVKAPFVLHKLSFQVEICMPPYIHNYLFSNSCICILIYIYMCKYIYYIKYTYFHNR